MTLHDQPVSNPLPDDESEPLQRPGTPSPTEIWPGIYAQRTRYYVPDPPAPGQESGGVPLVGEHAE